MGLFDLLEGPRPHDDPMLTGGAIGFGPGFAAGAADSLGFGAAAQRVEAETVHAVSANSSRPISILRISLVPAPIS